MPIDQAARSTQIAGIISHAGDLLTYVQGRLPFTGKILAWQPAETDADRNIGDDTSVLVKAARAVFGATLPVQGQNFTDAAGRIYRVQGIRSTPPTNPTIEFICGTVVVPISP